MAGCRGVYCGLGLGLWVTLVSGGVTPPLRCGGLYCGLGLRLRGLFAVEAIGVPFLRVGVDILPDFAIIIFISYYMVVERALENAVTLRVLKFINIFADIIF